MSAYSYKNIITDQLTFTNHLGNCYICNLYNDDDLYVQTPILETNINLSKMIII